MSSLMLVVSAAIITTLDRKKHLLLGKRSKTSSYPGLWCTPGGKVEKGETLAEALARELLEELGLYCANIVGERVLSNPFYVHRIQSTTTGNDCQIFCYDFIVKPFIARAISAKDGLDEVRWFDYESLRGLLANEGISADVLLKPEDASDVMTPADALNIEKLLKLLK